MKKLDSIGIFLVIAISVLIAHCTASWFQDMEEVCLKTEEVCEWKDYPERFCIDDKRCDFNGYREFIDEREFYLKQYKICHQACVQKIMARVVREKGE